MTPDDVSNAGFPYMSARAIRVGAVDVWAQRVTYVGELGWELYAPVGSTPAPSGTRSSRPAGPSGITPVGYKALESLRLEKGYRYWSADITPADNPYEAGLGFCVRLGKGDFIGRDALVRVKADGRDAPPRDGDDRSRRRRSTAARRSGGTVEVLGRLRSGGYGYTVGQNIGLVYLPVDLARAVGTPLEVEVFGERVPAEVAPDVLYDPQGDADPRLTRQTAGSGLNFGAIRG